MENLAEWLGGALTIIGVFFVFLQFVSSRPTRQEVRQMIEAQVAPLREAVDKLDNKLDLIINQVGVNTGIIKKMDESLDIANDAIIGIQKDVKNVSENYMSKNDCRFLQDTYRGEKNS